MLYNFYGNDTRQCPYGLPPCIIIINVFKIREAPGRLCGYQQKDVDNNDMIIIAAPETNRVSAYARPNSETELKCE